MEALTNHTALNNTETTAVKDSTEVLRVVTFKCGCKSHRCLVKGKREMAGCSRECTGCRDAYFVIPCGKHRGKRVEAVASRVRRVETYN